MPKTPSALLDFLLEVRNHILSEGVKNLEEININSRDGMIDVVIHVSKKENKHS